MQFRGDGQGDIGHGLDYVRAHNQTFGGTGAGATGGTGKRDRLTAETLYYTSRVRSLRDGTQVWKTADDSIGGWAIRPLG